MDDKKKADPAYAGFSGSTNEPKGEADDKPHADPKGADAPKHPHPADDDDDHKGRRGRR